MHILLCARLSSVRCGLVNQVPLCMPSIQLGLRPSFGDDVSYAMKMGSLILGNRSALTLQISQQSLVTHR